MSPLSRRSVLAAAPAALGTLLLDPTAPVLAEEGASDSVLAESWPTQEAEVVQEVVSVSHFDLERVKALVEPRPELAKSAWDWGFGDWESALGAAAHTGNRPIVEYLLEKGARPDLFTAAMLGQLSVVKAVVEAYPGIQRHRGPHGITLRRHAEAGGDEAKAVVAYLDEVGGADERPLDLELPLDKEAYVGVYGFGPGPNDRFEVLLGRRGNLMLQRGEGTARSLLHQGDHLFHPGGAPSAHVRFLLKEGQVHALEVLNPERVVLAVR